MQAVRQLVLVLISAILLTRCGSARYRRSSLSLSSAACLRADDGGSRKPGNSSRAVSGARVRATGSLSIRQKRADLVGATLRRPAFYGHSTGLQVEEFHASWERLRRAAGGARVIGRRRPLDALPEKGGPVLARPPRVAKVATPELLEDASFQRIRWEIRGVRQRSAAAQRTPTIRPMRGPMTNGWLHLRIAQGLGEWTCARSEALTAVWDTDRICSYVHDVSHLEPAAVFGMFTWDDACGPTIAKWTPKSAVGARPETRMRNM